MSKRTRIFNVEYFSQEVFDGRRNGEPVKENKSIIAKNAAQAISLVGIVLAKEVCEFEDDEKKGKMIKATRTDFDPIGVALEAEA